MVSRPVDISPASRCANIETMTRNARVTIAAVIGATLLPLGLLVLENSQRREKQSSPPVSSIATSRESERRQLENLRIEWIPELRIELVPELTPEELRAMEFEPDPNSKYEGLLANLRCHKIAARPDVETEEFPLGCGVAAIFPAWLNRRVRSIDLRRRLRAEPIRAEFDRFLERHLPDLVVEPS